MEDPNSEVDDPPDAINASIGSVTQSDYTLDARVFDEYIDRYDVLASIAAGNIYQPVEKSVHSPGVFYNGICVGGINDMDDQTFTNQHIWFHSRRGPTNGGRKKPDLVALVEKHTGPPPDEE